MTRWGSPGSSRHTKWHTSTWGNLGFECVQPGVSPQRRRGTEPATGNLGEPGWVADEALPDLFSLFCLQGWGRQTRAGSTRHTGHSWNAIQMSQGYVLPLVKWGFWIGSGCHTLISHLQWDFWVSLISAWQRNSSLINEGFSVCSGWRCDWQSVTHAWQNSVWNLNALLNFLHFFFFFILL